MLSLVRSLFLVAKSEYTCEVSRGGRRYRWIESEI